MLSEWIGKQSLRLLVSALMLSGAGQALQAQDAEAKKFPTSQEFYDGAVAETKGQKWQPIFNGKNLDGWKVVLRGLEPGQDPEKVIQVVDGAVHVFRDTPAGKTMPFGVIITDDSFSHYRLRYEYKWGVKKFAPRENAVRDAGLLFHTIGPEKIWPMSVEFQIQENDTGDIFTVYTQVDSPVNEAGNKFLDESDGGKWKTFYRPNGITRVIKSVTNENDGWNQVEVVVRGDQAVHMINGVINNYCVNLKAPQGESQEVSPLKSGRIAFQIEGAELFYRNIDIIPLKDPEAEKTSAIDESLRQESAAPLPPMSPEDSLKAWSVRDGYRIELVAAEPLVKDPVAIDWGKDGKLWVVEMADYPTGMDGKGKSGGRIRYLEDRDGDGKYDHSTLFMDGVNFPTGIVAWGNGVIVTAAPEIFYAEDSDGDGRADKKKILLSGFIEGNEQLRLNGLRWGLDGWLHCASGSHTPSFGAASRIRSHLTGKEIALGSRDFRFHPETGELEPLSGPSQFGRNRDDWGNWFGVQNSFPLWHYVLEDRYLIRNPHVPAKDGRLVLTAANPKLYPVSQIEERMHNFHEAGRFTSACSGMIYRDNLLFPGSDQTHSFTCDPVHNIVQHNVLTRDGISFQLKRDMPGEEQDFLASSDRWCRPVMVRTGPDGALWVVDMYRYVIEHPHWLPEDGRKAVAPFLRAGDQRGRIYRVLPENEKARDWVNIQDKSISELISLLDHPNGWVRDAVQRELASQKKSELNVALKAFQKSGATPQGRLHALSALDEAGLVDDEAVLAGLNDASADVRRHAIRVTENLKTPSQELVRKIAELADDPSQTVQLQAALTLGNFSDERASEALVGLWKKGYEANHWRVALMSSLNATNVTAVLQTLADSFTPSEKHAHNFQDVASQAVLMGHRKFLESAIQEDPKSPESLARSLVLTVALLSNAANSRSDTTSSNPAAEEQSRLIARGREIAVDPDQSLGLRKLSIPLLFREESAKQQDLEVARQLLLPSVPGELQQVLINRLGELGAPEYGELMLSQWPSYSPATRNRVLQTVASRPRWYPVLATAFDRQLMVPADVSLAMQEQLLRHRDKKLTQGLQKHFQQPAQGFTAQAMAELLAKMPEKGDLLSGRDLFQKHCSDCHQFRGMGFAVGPNLESLTSNTRTRVGLVEAIVNPNSAIEANYLNYFVVLDDGRSEAGMIKNESEHSLTLLKAKEESVPIFRENIEEMRSTGKSLMPEGFDRLLKPEELADLVIFLLSSEEESASAAKSR